MDLDAVCKSGAEKAFAQLDLVDLNVILHRADGEEQDATGGSSQIILDGDDSRTCRRRRNLQYTRLRSPRVLRLRGVDDSDPSDHRLERPRSSALCSSSRWNMGTGLRASSH